MNRRAALLALLAVVALAAVAGTASSPPQPLCSVCDSGFERTADDHGVAAMVAQSTVEVVVREDGTARWTVRNRLWNGSTADRLRSDSDLLDEVVADSLDRGKPRGVTDVSSEVDGDTVVVTFEHESFAERTWGDAVVVDYLHSQGSRAGYGFDAHRFEVVGPEGSVVVNDPASGRVGDGRVTWVSDDSDGWYRVDEYVPDTYVAFAPDDGPLATAAVRVVFAQRALPVVATNLAMLAPAVLGIVGGLAGFRRARLVWWFRPRHVNLTGAAILGGGVLAIAHPVYAGSVPLINGAIMALSALGVVYGLAGGLTLWVDRTRAAVPWWWLLAPGVGVLAFAGVLMALPDSPNTLRTVSGGVLPCVPLAVAFPLGYAVGRGHPRAELGALAVTAGAVVAVAVRYVSFTSEPGAGGLVGLLALVVVVFGLLAALPLYLLGDSLARVVGSESAGAGE